MLREPVVPTAQDINVYDSLDERSAIKHFLGKNLDEAETMFRDSPYVLEDFMHMGPKAFCYYIQAFLSYLKSDASTEDSEGAFSFCSMLEFWLEFDVRERVAALPALLDGVRYMISHADKFKDRVELDPALILEAIRSHQIDTRPDDEILADLDLPARLAKLKSRLESLLHAGQSNGIPSQRS
ncbi:MAG: hypothetical protein SGJ19_10220 [Planctomycetia bacterium]|nr:hypothetical protein [Planctomycetia bacterium]